MIKKANIFPTSAVWDGEKWVVTADYRGEIFYNKQTRQAVVVINIGEIPAGVTSLKPEGSVVWNDITEVWEAVESKLSEEINAVQIQLRSYIYSKYGAGTQSTMTAVYLEPTTVLKDKDRILAVWNWIKSVLFYYYNLKKQLETGTKLSDLKVDFTQFNETDPKVTLESFI